jgi:hypothetical protein
MKLIYSRFFSLTAPIFSICVFLFPAITFAAGIPTMLGQLEYRTNCATCHGEEGKGDGPMADQLAVKPANLQQISAKSGGKFPADQIYQIIDGRESVRAHGSREMPIWGAAYSASLRSMWGWRENDPEDRDVEAVINGRILSLVYYLQSIQAE